MIRALVLDGETRACLAVTRSLGTAGVLVGVQASSKSAIAGKSKFASKLFLSPSPQESPGEFLTWLEEQVRRWQPAVLIPVTNVTLALVLEREEVFRNLCNLPFPSHEVYVQTQDKAKLAYTAEELGINIPNTLSLPAPISWSEFDRKSILKFNYPAVLKTISSDVKRSGHFSKLPVFYADTPADVFVLKFDERYPELANQPLMLQERIEGWGVGVFALFVEGEPVATFAHRRLLEKPPSGGVSVLSESIPLADAPVKSALKLLRQFRWHGIAMVEFKRTVTGKTYLIEINPRFWGSTQLAIDAGRNFPKLLLEYCVAGTNLSKSAINDYETGIRLRWLLGTLDHFFISLKLKPLQTLRQVILSNSLQLFTKSKQTRLEVLRRDDIQPFWAELKNYVAALFKRARKKPLAGKKDDRLNVLLFIESGGPGGAEQMVVTLAQALLAQGVNVSVATLRTGWLTDTIDELGIKRHKIETKRHFDLGLPFRLARIIRDYRYDVMHSHLLDSNFYGTIAARIAGVGQLATEHGDIHHTEPKRWLKTKIKILSLLHASFVAVSDFTADRLKELGLDGNQICTVPNPVRAQRLITADERDSLRTQLAIAGEPPAHWLWVHVANLRPVKDQATLLKAFAYSLRRTTRPQTLCIIGDGPEREALETLVDELELRNFVRFLGFLDDVPRWLGAADGFVLSSRSEALPVSLLEAGIAGLTLVATDVGGISSVITDKKTGYLALPGSYEILGQQMTWAVENYQLSKQLGEAAQAFIKKHYSAELIASRYVELYESVRL